MSHTLLCLYLIIFSPTPNSPKCPIVYKLLRNAQSGRFCHWNLPPNLVSLPSAHTQNHSRQFCCRQAMIVRVLDQKITSLHSISSFSKRPRSSVSPETSLELSHTDITYRCLMTQVLTIANSNYVKGYVHRRRT